MSWKYIQRVTVAFSGRVSTAISVRSLDCEWLSCIITIEIIALQLFCYQPLENIAGKCYVWQPNISKRNSSSDIRYIIKRRRLSFAVLVQLITHIHIFVLKRWTSLGHASLFLPQELCMYDFKIITPRAMVYSGSRNIRQKLNPRRLINAISWERTQRL